MEELPIKYVKDKNGKFIPITSPIAVINSEGKNINELFVLSADLLDLICPVGNIMYYPTSPAAKWGGTWEQIKDKFILAAGDTYASGATGGEETHLLKESEIPSHTHTGNTADAGSHTHTTSAKPSLGSRRRYTVEDGSGWWPVNSSSFSSVTSSSNGTHKHSFTTAATGGGTAHNNMPPYIAFYVWKRLS